MNFQGYSDETFEFLMAIHFNNNVDFFHANHDWYLRSVREPSLALAESLSDVIEKIDPTVERRPNRVVSRINRDIRFSKDKSPYRDYLWLSFHRTNAENVHADLFYDMSADGARCGMGFYGQSRGPMNALRHLMLIDSEHIAALFETLQGEFNLHLNSYKRMNVPQDIPETLKPIYMAKDFYFEKPIRDFSIIKSPALSDMIAESFRHLAELFQILAALVPIENIEGNNRKGYL